MKSRANHYPFNILLTRLVSAVAVLCLIGLQFIGIAHEFNHHAYFNTTPTIGVPAFAISKDTLNAAGAGPNTKHSDFQINANSSEPEFSFGHNASNKDCQLFNGLALSSVIASGLFVIALLNNYSQGYIKAQTSLNLSATPCPYSAQAPPSF